MASLASNLSMADEPFLETALCDRAKTVRQQAVALLVTLPDSQLCQRMVERVTPFVKIQPNSSTINVVLPKAFDPAWKKDGIIANHGADLGEKAGWLYQMIACIPLNQWQGAPTNIVKAMAGHK